MSEEKKITKMLPGTGSLGALLDAGPAAIKMMAAANGHRGMEPVQTQTESDVPVPPRQTQAKPQAKVAAGSAEFRRGQVVRHKPTGSKVTILSIQASGCEVVDHRGKKWLANKSNLS